MSDRLVLDDVIAAFNQQFSGGINTEELFNCVRDLLPLSEQDYKIVSSEGTVKRFKAEIKCKPALKRSRNLLKTIVHKTMKHYEDEPQKPTRATTSFGMSSTTDVNIVPHTRHHSIQFKTSFHRGHRKDYRTQTVFFLYALSYSIPLPQIRKVLILINVSYRVSGTTTIQSNLYKP